MYNWDVHPSNPTKKTPTKSTLVAAQERMCRLQKVELRIAAFSLGQTDQKLLPVARHELRSEFDDVGVHGGNVWVVHHILISRRRLHLESW